MGKKTKIITWSVLGLFVVIQLIPSDLPENQPLEGYDFFTAYGVPADMAEMIRTSCYDCHSQEVNYPWYAYVAPSSWLVSRDVKKGRGNLDFSRWGELSKKDQLKIVDDIGEEVKDGAMPLPIYVFMHPAAALDENKREKIVRWTDTLAERIFED